MPEQKVGLSDRDSLIEVIKARLEFMTHSGEFTMDHLAALIADDILSSLWKIERDSTMLARGKEAGYERGLRDAIGAVGTAERFGWANDDPESEYELIRWRQGQHEIAKLSSKGLDALWGEEIGENSDR